MMKPLSPGDPAPDVTLDDHTGHRVALGDAWRQQPIALFFVRHFG